MASAAGHCECLDRPPRLQAQPLDPESSREEPPVPELPPGPVVPPVSLPPANPPLPTVPPDAALPPVVLASAFPAVPLPPLPCAQPVPCAPPLPTFERFYICYIFAQGI